MATFTAHSTVVPQQTCGHKHRSAQAATDCGKMVLGFANYEVREKATYVSKSRATRLSDALSSFATLDDQISDAQAHAGALTDWGQQTLDEPDAPRPVAPSFAAVDTIVSEAVAAKGEVDSLHEEMETWRDNLDGANMSHLPKYDEVSECVDSLEELTGAFDDLEGMTVPEAPGEGSTSDDWDAYVTELEELNEKIQECMDGDVNFPGMF